MEIDIILNEFTSPNEAAELGLMAENYGVRGVWASNYGWSRDPFMALSLLADRSSKIRLGPMAISAAELHPLKMANLLFSLNEMSHGRAMIMVGGGGAVLQSIGKERERMLKMLAAQERERTAERERAERQQAQMNEQLRAAQEAAAQSARAAQRAEARSTSSCSIM